MLWVGQFGTKFEQLRDTAEGFKRFMARASGITKVRCSFVTMEGCIGVKSYSLIDKVWGMIDKVRGRKQPLLESYRGVLKGVGLKGCFWVKSDMSHASLIDTICSSVTWKGVPG
eukprot:1147827-Pelagomonas_calceolata.AAC.3